ncbi:hypothetical protein [Pseudomonas guariconensis]|uniref:hypothetical protein n=1 Tax=Pseudomonas guariconensis TaxID=1288410 RepID=UPI002FE64719
MSENKHLIDRDRLPTDFPTHRHSSEFWEQLGRAVATFGFLEEILKKAIFALTATRRYAPDEIEEAFGRWERKLGQTLTDTLGRLTKDYGQALRAHPKGVVANVEDLIERLHRAAILRNVLCHGSWQAPREEGRSLPTFVSNELMIFNTPVDTLYLQQIRRGIVELSCDVIESVTGIGLQFPGSNSPGQPIWSVAESNIRN